MPQIYFETDELKKLSAIELIKRQEKLSQMISDASKRSTTSDTMIQLRNLEEAYTAEIDRRYEEGLIDEDEIDAILEEDFDV